MTTWVCRECGCDVAEYGVCRCFDDEMECFCAECAWETHGIRLILGSAAKPVLIAAAPEMLEALEAAKQFIQNGIQYGYINMPDKDCGDSALETPAKIEAAIQKARGKEKRKGLQNEN